MSKYTDLITNYHAEKPLYVSHIDLFTRSFIDVSSALSGLVKAFDIDTAIGSQLDVLGEWIGLSREVRQPITGIYFSFDTDGLGFDQAVWQGPHDPDSGYTTLSDDTYRLILKAKIAINHWDGTHGSIPDILEVALKGSGLTMQIVDNQDMTLSVLVFMASGTENVSREVLAVISQGYLTLKTAGVRVKETVIPAQGNQFFGFDLENRFIAGFDQGAWELSL